MNAFHVLGLPVSLLIDEVKLKNVFLERAKQLHPDVGGSAAEFTELDRAQKSLMSPSLRLREWLAAQGHDFDSRGAIDHVLMDRFVELGHFFNDLDHFLQKRDRVSSSLARALMEAEAMRWRERVESWQAQLQLDWNEKIQQFPQFESGAIEFSVIQTVARDLIFLEKWLNQLRERYAQLWS